LEGLETKFKDAVSAIKASARSLKRSVDDLSPKLRDAAKAVKAARHEVEKAERTLRAQRWRAMVPFIGARWVRRANDSVELARFAYTSAMDSHRNLKSAIVSRSKAAQAAEKAERTLLGLQNTIRDAITGPQAIADRIDAALDDLRRTGRISTTADAVRINKGVAEIIRALRDWEAERKNAEIIRKEHRSAELRQYETKKIYLPVNPSVMSDNLKKLGVRLETKDNSLFYANASRIKDAVVTGEQIQNDARLLRYVPVNLRNASLVAIGNKPDWRWPLFELPRSAGRQNMHELFDADSWKRITEATKKATGWRCRICGSVSGPLVDRGYLKMDRKPSVELHECWTWQPSGDSPNVGIQKLEDLLVVCKSCHLGIFHHDQLMMDLKRNHDQRTIGDAMRLATKIGMMATQMSAEDFLAAKTPDKKLANLIRHTERWMLDLSLIERNQSMIGQISFNFSEDNARGLTPDDIIGISFYTNDGQYRSN
jgi:hypothetical protein